MPIVFRSKGFSGLKGVKITSSQRIGGFLKGLKVIREKLVENSMFLLQFPTN